MYRYIDTLVEYGVRTGLTDACEEVYVRNLLLDLMGESGYRKEEKISFHSLSEILAHLTDIAVERGLCQDSSEQRDIFDTKLMNCLMKRPAEVRRLFAEKYEESPEAATSWYYQLSKDSNYIRTDRVKKDRKWRYECEYGTLDITINLSKPEKDPRDIAAALNAPKGAAYPLCQLCRENEGYAGRIGHPARANHRIIPMILNNEDFFLQYSPYVYYNEHCIVFNSAHTPMKIDEAAFKKLFDFVTLFPHYFIGSNADLPIVGGSILTHDHFQGGRYEFAMERAPIEEEFAPKGYEDIRAGIVKWPLSVLRLRSADKERLTELAVHILSVWRGYTDEKAQVFAYTDGTPHNTITPIVRRRGEDYEIDLCLRNNLTTEEHPLGLYHPHEEYHHIKKENIGLIEVMGLAVLPARLNKELSLITECVLSGRDIKEIKELRQHEAWLSSFISELDGKDKNEIDRVLEREVGRVFSHVLEDAGVYKRDEKGREALRRFIAAL